jgi:hypothetical protein
MGSHLTLLGLAPTLGLDLRVDKVRLLLCAVVVEVILLKFEDAFAPFAVVA